MNKNLPISSLNEYAERFAGDKKNAAAMNAVAKHGLTSAADFSLGRRMRHEYSLELSAGKITNQKSSGRCWMFAALNTMRADIMKKLNLETFELSQNYTLFYDKLEKCNFFLESILVTLDQPTDGRLIAWLLSSPLGDGGQWDMFKNLIIKYGVVPKDNMPETYHSSNTGMMTRLMTLKLREYACVLREQYSSGASADALRAQKNEMLYEMYSLLCICLGTPPRSVLWEGRDKDEKFIRISDISPTEFFNEYIGWDLSQYVSLINAPTADKPYGRTYTVDFLGNVYGGDIVKYLNVPIEVLKRTAIAQMQDGHPVWFGCDVGQWLDRESGTMDMNTFDYASLLGLSFGMNKAQRLDYGDSLMTHAMVFQGVNINSSGQPDRWRVENSWGDASGKEGMFVMSDAWFDEFMYQVLVPKKYLTAEELEQFEQEPIHLQPWDPMGSLAHML